MRAELGKVARGMEERLEIHRKRYSESVMLFLLGLAMVAGIVVLVRVPVSAFGSGFVGGLLKTLLAMALVGLALLIYWRVQQALSAVPEMVIDGRGILMRVGGREQLLAWDDIVGLRIDTVRGGRSLHVSPAPDLVLGQSVGRLVGWMEIILIKGRISVDFHELLDFVKRVAPPHLAAQL
tara:strand:- start:2491 stop:3030 length:540 start_codon:yes stop_codon:yes gene_type:complete